MVAFDRYYGHVRRDGIFCLSVVAAAGRDNVRYSWIGTGAISRRGEGPLIVWVRRLGEVPAVSHDAPGYIDRSTLAGHDVIPQVRVYEVEGKRREMLWWPGEEGGSASPAHHRAFGGTGEASTAAMIRNVYEGLELPGTPSDYHFLIQGCVSQLWSRRREEPGVVYEVEKLCWLDVRLVQACPDAVSDEYSDDHRFYSILTFPILIEIYEREGFLRDALEVAELAARYGQGDDARERLWGRIESVESETSAEQA